MKERIQEYEKQILLAEETIKEKDNEKIETIKKITEILPTSPGPNLMSPRTPRAQDVAYQAIIEATNKEKESSKTEEQALKGLVNSLAASLKASTKVDISMPPKFQGNDSK